MNWAELHLVAQSIASLEGGKRSPAIPSIIELDISKKIHFIGRIPNPAATFQHRYQHSIPLQFLSATHCSIGLNETKAYQITDYSSNGTFITRCADSSNNVELIGSGNSTQLCGGDIISFKFKDSCVSYRFLSISSRFPTEVALVASPSDHLESQLSRLQEELTAVEGRLKDTISKNENLQKENYDTANVVQSLQATISHKDSEIVTLIQSSNALEANVAATEAFARKLKDEAQDLRQKNLEISSKLDSVTADAKYKADQVVSRDRMLLEANRVSTEERQRRVLAENEVVRLNDELSAAENRIKALEVEKADINDSLSLARVDLLVLKVRVHLDRYLYDVSASLGNH